MQNKYIIPLSILYVLLNIFTQMVSQKPILIPIESIVDAKLALNAGIVVGISWICLCDIIAEVYGMKISIKLYWCSIVCIFMIIVFGHFLMKLPSPAFSHEPLEHNIFRQFFIELLVRTPIFVIAWFINIYFLTKWKFLLGGRYFWLRSVSSSIIGEIIFTAGSGWVLYQFGMLLSTLNNKELIIRILWGLFMKMILIAILAFPGALIVILLKKIDKSDDGKGSSQKFNPFQATVNNLNKPNL